MTSYSKIDIKLTNQQIGKLKDAIKNNKGATWRMNINMFNNDNSLHELFLTLREKTELRNAFANNMSTDIKLLKA